MSVETYLTAPLEGGEEEMDVATATHLPIQEKLDALAIGTGAQLEETTHGRLRLKRTDELEYGRHHHRMRLHVRA